MEYQKLLDEAFKAMKNAYAPYSNYHVGSAVLCNDEIIIGANIENASFGATNCGERTAIFSAYAKGYRKDDIKAIAIVTDGKTLAAPCGICRQVLVELLNGDTPIILSNGLKTEITDINKLLPMQFKKEDLVK